MMTRVYRTKWSERIVAIVFLLVGLFVLVGAWSQVLLGNREANFFEVMAPLIFFLFCGFFVVGAFYNTVSLSETTIEKHGLSGTLVLPFENIEGRRRYVESGGGEGPSVTHLVLESNDDRVPRLNIEEIYRFDDSFYAWFNGLPDLDERDRKKAKAASSSVRF